MLKLFFYTLLVFFQSYVIQDIDKHQVKNLLNNEVTVIDVRTEKEFKEGNIKTSFNLDFQKREFIDSLEKLEQNSKKISDQVGLIWLTIVGFIIYLEFFK